MTSKKKKTAETAETIHTGFRLSKTLLADIDRIAALMSQPGMPVTRVEVVRIMLHQSVKAWPVTRRAKEAQR